MSSGIDQLLSFHQQALRVRDQRQQVLASNIANADTPNYKARDMDFKAALQGALSGSAAAGGVALATSSPAHLAGKAGLSGSAGLLYRTPAQGSVDGNTVNVDAERAAFAGNAMQYEFNLIRLTSQIKGMLTSIQG
jgi:flagellar basal-body rod protein FlgB